MNDQMEELKPDEAYEEKVFTLYPLFLILALASAAWGGYTFSSLFLLHFGLAPDAIFVGAVAMGLVAMLVMRWLCRVTMEFR